jgi:hypothetical protein
VTLKSRTPETRVEILATESEPSSGNVRAKTLAESFELMSIFDNLKIIETFS